ncbi:hypothetical protein NI389_01490 [Pseudoalteromonas xiamenensis]|uniref:TolB family protein n=1 Tax=Pseudoalteromonas xiamenensis TaxID=882626 RepID=UPI0027E483C1|nr:hypothetical protein [Pseudoalteromonas xiamenensis]WMN60125.1 hypothetical protein NI389_01490 [Pseudoalteromonas xiamenensis]
MNYKKQLCVFAVMVSAMTNSYANPNGDVFNQAYLGERPPALVAKVFAPDIISLTGRYEGVISFTPDLKEIYFGANDSDNRTHIYHTKYEGQTWTPVTRIDFTKGRKEEEIHPFVSPDGRKIYFTALSSDLTYNKIWYVNKTSRGWSEAHALPAPVNEDQVFFPIQAHSGDLYYYNLTKGRNFKATADGANYSSTEELNLDFGVHVSISPNEDYLVMNAQNKNEIGRRDNDLFVSFKTKKGTWGTPINLGATVNSIYNDKTPTISPDGKYLFFGRDEADGKANIYWVSTDVIEKMRPNYL